jgi:hypothetical protein
VGVTALGIVAPKGQDVDSVNVAIIQGGGPQRTRFGNGDARAVFERHLAATRQLVKQPVDVILWPENVIAVEGRLAQNPEFAELQQLAKDMDATLIVGATEGISQKDFLNAAIVINPDGTMGERFDKVRCRSAVRPLAAHHHIVGASDLCATSCPVTATGAAHPGRRLRRGHLVGDVLQHPRARRHRQRR